MDLSALSTVKVAKNEDITRFVGFLAPAGAIFISLLILIIIVWPKFNEVLALRKSNQELTIRADKLEVKAQKLAGLNKSELEQNLGVSEQLLPSDQETFTLLRQIENAAGASGALLNRLDTTPGSIVTRTTGSSPSASVSGGASGAPGTGTGAGPLPISGLDKAPAMILRISISGDYRSILQFLINTLAIPRVVEISDLTLSTSDGQLVSASMATSGYWQPLPSELGSIEADIEELTDTKRAKLSEIGFTGFVAPTTVVPPVPIGRSDLFTPY